MHILLISARYFPHRGGLESVVHHLAQEFLQQGHTVRIVTNRYPRTLPYKEIIDDVQVTRLHFLLPDFKQIGNFRFDLWLAGLWFRFYTAQVLRGIINEFQPDVINTHYLNEAADFTGRCLATRFSSIPWIISLHGGDVDGEPLLGATNRNRFSRLSRQANRVTACSHFLATQAQTLEPALQGKIEVIHNGVDAQLFAEAKPYLAENPYILALGQLTVHKGFDLLIEAFARVAGNYLQVQLWIAGEGQERSALDLLIRQKQLMQHVRLFGKVDETTVASLMAGSLFIAMPSRREPFGMVALEGMAAGKAVLAAPVGGLPEFLSVPPNRLVALTIDDWAVALDEWLHMAENGLLRADGNAESAANQAWSHVARQYLQLYNRVI